MTKSGVTINFTDNTKKFSRQVSKNMTTAITDVTLDMKRVASASAPHDTGFLEKNASHDIQVGAKYVEGTVGFSARDKGFDYATWTHDATYNLGKKSARKTGGKSKYGAGSVAVGKGYLTNTLSTNQNGYFNHMLSAYKDALK